MTIFQLLSFISYILHIFPISSLLILTYSTPPPAAKFHESPCALVLLSISGRPSTLPASCLAMVKASLPWLEWWERVKMTPERTMMAQSSTKIRS